MRGNQGGRDRSLKLLLPEISSMMEKRGLDLESSVAGVKLGCRSGPGVVLAHTVLGHAERLDPESLPFQLLHPSEPRRSLRGRGRRGRRSREASSPWDWVWCQKLQNPGWGEMDTGTSPHLTLPQSLLGWALGEGTLFSFLKCFFI